MFCLKYVDPITNWLGVEEILGEISIWSISFFVFRNNWDGKS